MAYGPGNAGITRRLSSRDWDGQRLAGGRSELNDVGAMTATA